MTVVPKIGVRLVHLAPEWSGRCSTWRWTTNGNTVVARGPDLAVSRGRRKRLTGVVSSATSCRLQVPGFLFGVDDVNRPVLRFSSEPSAKTPCLCICRESFGGGSSIQAQMDLRRPVGPLPHRLRSTSGGAIWALAVLNRGSAITGYTVSRSHGLQHSGEDSSPSLH